MVCMMQAQPVYPVPTRAAHWQPALGRARSAGELVTGVDDIDQAIRIILSTPLGSDAHRPQFGCRVHDYIDWPIERARPHLVREIVAALNHWEPRMRIVRVQVQAASTQQLEHVIIRVRWRTADGVIRQTQVGA